MKKKRIISFLLAVAIILTSVPAIPLRADAQTSTSGTTGDCTWTLDGTELTISGNGKMEDYSNLSVLPWDESITKLIIKPGVTSIGSYAFDYCDKLADITIPDSVTNIGTRAFSGCKGLTSLTLSEGLISIGDSAFSICESLTDIKIPDSVTHIGASAFYACSNLTRVELGKSVTSIGNNAFNSCISLEDISIPDSVMYIGSYAFDSCYNLVFNTYDNGNYLGNIKNPYVVLIGSNSTSVTSYKIHDNTKFIYGNSLSWCTNLTHVTIPDGVRGIGDYAFVECGKLASVTIPSSVTSIGNGAFSYCGKLASVIIPNSVISIGNSAFSYCKKLASVTIPNSVASIGNKAFYDCDGLTNITIPGGVSSIGNEVLYSCNSLTNVEILDGVSSIGDYAFDKCNKLTNIVIPDSVISIGESILRGCSSLENITIPFVGKERKIPSDTWQYPFGYLFGTSSYTGSTATKQTYHGSSATGTMSSTYYIPDSLRTVKVTGGHIPYGAFDNCSGLTDIRIGAGVNDIGSYAFRNCSNLNAVHMAEGVKGIDNYAFANCSNLTNISIPDSISTIGESVFSNCTSLTYDAYSNGKYLGNANNPYVVYANTTQTNITSCQIHQNTKIILDSALKNCIYLTNVVVPDSVVNIGKGAFSGCRGLQSITLPFVGQSATILSGTCPYPFGYIFGTASYTGGTATKQRVYSYYNDSGSSYTTPNYYIPTNLKTVNVTGGYIPFYSFENCSNLTNIYISDKVTGIGKDAFIGCSNLMYSTYDNGQYLGNPDNPYVVLASVMLMDSESCKIHEDTKIISYYAFSNADLTNITIPEGVVSIGEGAFYQCYSLGKVILPDSVEEIGAEAFYGCLRLADITIPDKVTEIGKNMFYSCVDLERITIGKGVSRINTSAFTGCNWLERIEVLKDNPYYCSVNGILYNKDKTEIIWTPKNHKVLFVVNYSYANGTVAFASVREYLKVGEVYSAAIPEMRGYSTSRDKISGTMPAEDVVIDVIYYENVKLTSGNCNDNISWTLYDDGSLIFRGTGEMPDYTSGSAPWVAYAEKVKTIYIDPRITSIGAYAFENCSNLTFVDYGYSIDTIGEYAFSGCSSLKSFKLPETVTEISQGAFSGCTGLKSVVIPDNITLVGENAFSNCSELIQVTIGGAVTAIEDDAFANCGKLTQVYFRGEPTTLGENALGDTNGKYVYYYTSVKAWDTVIVDGLWNGYTAIPYNAIAKENFNGTNIYIIKVVDKHNTPLENAVVNLGKDVQSTNKDGMAYFVKPTGAASLSVSCSNHITFEDSAFKATTTQIMDVIELSDRPSVVQGVRMNGESIATSVGVLNCGSDATVKIVVSGYSKYSIIRYELHQGSRLIATEKTAAKNCTFSVKASAFEEGETVLVKMYTSDGYMVASALNIDVIKLANISEGQILDELSQLELSFSLGSMGNYKVPVSLQANGGEKFYTTIDGRTIRVGINMDVGEFFEKNGKNASKSALQKMVDDSMKNFAKGKSGMEYNVCGYIEIEYLGNGEYYVKTSYVKIGVAAKLSFSAQASYFGIVGVYFKAGLSGESTLEMHITHFTPEEGFQIDNLDFAMESSLSVEGGAYLLWGIGSAGLYGKANMGFVLGLIPDVEFESVYITGEFGATWSVLWGLYSGKYVIASGDIYRWPEAQTYMLRTLSRSLYAAQQDPNSYELNDRAYLTNRSDWLSGEYLQKNIYSNVVPKIVECGDTTVMFWLDDNSERDSANFQTLYYSVYENGVWSKPAPVDDNGTFDCEFDVYTDSEKIYVVYTEMSSKNSGIESLNIMEQGGMESFISDVEVVVVVYENGTFGTPKQLTNNSECEILPNINLVDGELTTTWVQTNSVGLESATVDNAMFSSKLEGSRWTGPAKYIDGQNTISDITTVNLNHVAYAAYVVDGDGSNETKDDQVLVLRNEDGDGMELDKGLITNVGYTEMNGTSALTWYNNGKIYMITDPTQQPVCLVPDDASVGTNYQIVAVSDEQYLLTFVMSNYDESGNSSEGTDIYGVYIDNSGCLTTPVRLTETEGYVVNYSITYRDERLIAVFTETFADVSGGDVETVTNLRNVEIDFYTDVVLNGVDFDITKAVGNTAFDITLDVSNNGTENVDGLTVNFYDANRELLYIANCDVALESGDSEKCDVSIILPENISTKGYIIEVLPKRGMVEVTDADYDDNCAEFTLAYSDFSLEAEQKIIGEKNYIILSVSNMGNVSSKAVIEVYAPNKAGRMITSMETEHAIASGVTEQYFVELNALIGSEDDVVTCIVTPDMTDPYLINNKETVTLLHINDEVFVTDPEKVIYNPEISVNAANFDKYAPQDISLEIITGADSFSGIEGLKLDSDYSVNNNVVTINNDYIKGLDVGVHSLNLLFDYGYDEPTIRTLTITVSDSTPTVLSGKIGILGDAVVGNIVYADVSGIEPKTAKLLYNWSIDGITVSALNYYSITPQDYGNTLVLKVTGANGFVGEFSAEVKITLNKPIAPTAPIISKIGSSSFTVAKMDGVEYSIDLVTWQDSSTFSGLLPNHKYTVYARRKATETSFASDASKGVDLTTAKVLVAAPAVPELQSSTHNTITLVYDASMEYMIDGGNWSDNNVFTGLEANTTYLFYQRYKETDTAYASDYSVASFATADKTMISGEITISGEPQYGEVLAVDLTNFVGDLNSVSYQWYVDGMAISGAVQSTYTVTENDMGKTIEVQITGIDAYKGELEAIVSIRDYVLGDVDGDHAVTVRDATILRRFVAKWDGVTVDELAADVNNDGVVNIRDATILRRHVAKWEGYEKLWQVG